MGEESRRVEVPEKPVVRNAIWAGVALAAMGLAAGGVWLIVRSQPEPAVVETLQSGQVDAPGPPLSAADRSFNGTGVALLTGGVGRDAAVDRTGRIVVLGSAEAGGVPRVAVWRLTPAGRLDSAFGAGGVSLVPSSFPAGTPNTLEVGQALALDGLGRIVIAGTTQDAHGWSRVAVWRLTPDGSPDGAFHGNGRVVLESNAEPGAVYAGKAVAIDGRGRIVVAGSSRPLSVEGQSLREYLAVWRLTDGGEPDRAFHGTGLLTVPDTRGNVLAVDGASRILVAGATLGTRGEWTLAVWRFLSDGSADPDWNGGSVLTPRFADRALLPVAASGVAVAPDGKVVVLGVVYDQRRLRDADDIGVQQIGLWRFLPDGSPDRDFNPGAEGVALIAGTAGGRGPTAGDFGRALALDSRGRIVVAGSSRDRQGRRLLALWRRTPSGAADLAWGPAGASVQGHPPARGEEPNAVAIGMAADRQGRVLVAGAFSTRANTHLAVWRIKP